MLACTSDNASSLLARISHRLAVDLLTLLKRFIILLLLLIFSLLSTLGSCVSLLLLVWTSLAISIVDKTSGRVLTGDLLVLLITDILVPRAGPPSLSISTLELFITIIAVSTFKLRSLRSRTSQWHMFVFDTAHDLSGLVIVEINDVLLSVGYIELSLVRVKQRIFQNNLEMSDFLNNCN